MVKEKVITQMKFGLYVVEDEELLFAYTYKDIEEDNWVQVDDLAELSNSEYRILDYMLKLNYSYKLDGRFL